MEKQARPPRPAPLTARPDQAIPNHGATGFENRKPKHTREDGGHPQVKLLFAQRRQCGKALALARRIDHNHPGLLPEHPGQAHRPQLAALRRALGGVRLRAGRGEWPEAE